MSYFYLAPLEGITTYIYRNAYHKYFHPMDEYYTPFLVPHSKRSFNSREKNEILPEHNKGLRLIPQILTNQAEGFLILADALKELGYEEVNLNLGCPSKTVVSKGRGSGFLAHPNELNHFLSEIFEKSEIKISIKTRLGVTDPEEFYSLLDIFNQYPLTKLIIHPRLQADYYKNHPHLDLYEYSTICCRHPLCYNGDLFTAEKFDQICHLFPQTKAFMFGRGILGNPGLIDQILAGRALNMRTLWDFHDEIYTGYREILSGDRNVLFKMKELWFYMIHSFPNNEKAAKQIKKTESCRQYEEIVRDLFQSVL